MRKLSEKVLKGILYFYTKSHASLIPLALG